MQSSGAGRGGVRPLLAARRAGQAAPQAIGTGAWAAGAGSSGAVAWGRAALLAARRGGWAASVARRSRPVALRHGELQAVGGAALQACEDG